MALNIDTDGMRRTGALVDTAGVVLEPAFGGDVPACGVDDVSRVLMDNLNAWQGWLMQHVRAGAQQAFSAAAAIAGTASAYEAEDLAAAARYPGSGSAAAAAPQAANPGVSASAPAPIGSPTLSPTPDISGQDGEQLAMELESGAGPGPATAAAAQWTGIAAQATAANTALAAAQTQLLASGESAATGPLITRLTRASEWADAVAGHATALAAGFTAAAGLHTTTKAAVGSSQDWAATKAAYRQAVMNPMGAPVAQGYRIKLTGMQHSASSAMSAYQDSGQTASTPPGTLPDPGLDPHADGAPGSTADPTPDDKIDKRDKDSQTSMSEKGSGVQEMLSPVMSALGPLMKSMGQVNPMQSVSQIGQQLGQQAGNVTSVGKPASSPIKPAALAKGHHAAGGHKGGGGSPIKAAGLGGAVHPASLTGTPPASPAAAPMTPQVPVKGAASSSAGGMGMMPMGHRSGDKSVKVNSYEQPLPDVEDRGRPGVVPNTAKAEPVVKSAAANAVKARLAARKKEVCATDGT